MPRYRLKPGAQHQGMQPGDTIELTDSQAKAWADKFEADDGPAKPKGEPAKPLPKGPVKE